MAKNTIKVNVLADTKKAASALKKFADESGLSRLALLTGAGLKATGAALAGTAAATGAYVYQAIGQAGNLQQSIGAIDTIFKDSAAQMHDWAKDAHQSVGLTQNSYNELASVIGTQLKNGGTAMDEIGGKTNDLIGLGADLSSMFGGTTADAVAALSSALKGERDPIERYGMSLKQSAIEAKAAELGFKKVDGALSAEAEQAATLALIMEQTSDAHGNFAREADTVQGQQQRLAAQWEDLSARIGTQFLPILSRLGTWISETVMPALDSLASYLEANLGPALDTAGSAITTYVVPALTQLASWIGENVVPALMDMGNWITNSALPALQGLAQWAIDSQAWLLPLASGLAGIAIAIRGISIAKSAWQVVTTALTVAQTLLNAVLRANPIGIVITIIAGLVGALIALYNNNETVRKAIDAAWAAIKTAISAVADFITGTVWPGIKRVWDAMSSAAGGLSRATSDAFRYIVDGARSMYNGVTSTISSVIDWFRDLPGRIVSALSSIGSRMSDIGRNMINSLASALNPRVLIDKISSVIGDAIGWAKRLLGISSPSKVAISIGEDWGEGHVIGLQNKARRVRDTAATLAHAIIHAGRLPSSAPPLPAFPALPHPAAPLPTFAPTIHLATLAPTRDTARALADALETVWTDRGRRWA